MSSDYGHLAQVRDRAMAEPHRPQKLVNVRLDYLDAVLKHYVAVVTECVDQKGERAALARSLESALAAANDEITRLRVDVEALREDAAKCRAELLAIHEIASCGWSNVLQHPIAPADTLTVRDVKIMAIELLKGHQTAEPRVHG